KRALHGEDEADRRREGRDAIALPLELEAQIEIEAWTAAEGVLRLLAQSDEGKTGVYPKALLAAADHRVDPPSVHAHGMRAERRDAVDDDHPFERASDLRNDLLEREGDAR